jgi:Serine dehydrogenase proteinase
MRLHDSQVPASGPASAPQKTPASGDQLKGATDATGEAQGTVASPTPPAGTPIGDADATKATATPPIPPAYYATGMPAPNAIVDADLASIVIQMESVLKCRVFLMLCGGSCEMDDDLKETVYSQHEHMNPNERVALLLDSPGGQARSAYQISTMLRKYSSEFICIIPRYAKSAATLLSLGASKIYLGQFGELGPLDAQVHDPQREEYSSALDEVKILERLHMSAAYGVDRLMPLLIGRTGKRVSDILPLVLKFVSDTMRPMVEKIDTVHYSQMSRVLKVAEDYAIRLLQPHFSKDRAETIARRLVEAYPEHGFVIDGREAKQIGLQVADPPKPLALLINQLYTLVGDHHLVGFLREVPKS